MSKANSTVIAIAARPTNWRNFDTLGHNIHLRFAPPDPLVDFPPACKNNISPREWESIVVKLRSDAAQKLLDETWKTGFYGHSLDEAVHIIKIFIISGFTLCVFFLTGPSFCNKVLGCYVWAAIIGVLHAIVVAVAAHRYHSKVNHLCERLWNVRDEQTEHIKDKLMRHNIILDCEDRIAVGDSLKASEVKHWILKIYDPKLPLQNSGQGGQTPAAQAQEKNPTEEEVIPKIRAPDEIDRLRGARARHMLGAASFKGELPFRSTEGEVLHAEQHMKGAGLPRAHSGTALDTAHHEMNVASLKREKEKSGGVPRIGSLPDLSRLASFLDTSPVKQILENEAVPSPNPAVLLNTEFSMAAPSSPQSDYPSSPKSCRRGSVSRVSPEPVSRTKSSSPNPQFRARLGSWCSTSSVGFEIRNDRLSSNEESESGGADNVGWGLGRTASGISIAQSPGLGRTASGISIAQSPARRKSAPEIVLPDLEVSPHPSFNVVPEGSNILERAVSTSPRSTLGAKKKKKSRKSSNPTLLLSTQEQESSGDSVQIKSLSQARRLSAPQILEHIPGALPDMDEGEAPASAHSAASTAVGSARSGANHGLDRHAKLLQSPSMKLSRKNNLLAECSKNYRERRASDGSLNDEDLPAPDPSALAPSALTPSTLQPLEPLDRSPVKAYSPRPKPLEPSESQMSFFISG